MKGAIFALFLAVEKLFFLCNKTTNLHTHILHCKNMQQNYEYTYPYIRKYIYLAYALQIVINNGVLWLFGRFVFVKGLRATHHSLLTHGNLKIDVFKVLGCGDLKRIYIYCRFGHISERPC